MKAALSRFSYISVRDNWTKKMIESVFCDLPVTITPDPVFALNQNLGNLVPDREAILKKYKLPDNYVVISMFRQSLTKSQLDGLKSGFLTKGIECVVLPMPDEGVNFEHSFDLVIPSPLSPIDWYALIKYSKGYIGENMHPIVTCLHNAVPCYSIDNWGCIDFFRRTKNDGSSKVEDVLRIFGVNEWRSAISRGKCEVSPETIVNAIMKFPVSQVKKKATSYYQQYQRMMDEIIEKIDNKEI